MILSGYLRSAGDLEKVILLAIDTILGMVPQVHTFFKEIFQQAHSTPSAITLYRHRLTLHLAYCEELQLQYKQLLAEPAGFVSWATLDCSPQAGYDLILNGDTTIALSRLVEMFRMANELCSPLIDDVTKEEHESTLLENLVIEL